MGLQVKNPVFKKIRIQAKKVNFNIFFLSGKTYKIKAIKCGCSFLTIQAYYNIRRNAFLVHRFLNYAVFFGIIMHELLLANYVQ